MSSHDMRTEDGKHYKICDFATTSIYIYSGVLFLERKIVRPSFTHTSSFLMPGIQIQEIEIFESGSETEQPDNIDSSFVLPYAHITLILILYTGKLPAGLDHLCHHCRHIPGATQKIFFNPASGNENFLLELPNNEIHQGASVCGVLRPTAQGF
jgi:hypothetical protein